jgi:hypothetical protein
MFRSKHLGLPLYAAFLLLPQEILSEELPTSPPKLVMGSGTPVQLQLAETISSAHAHKGDRLKFVVVKDVEVGGFTVIRAGALAEGSLVEVKGKRPFGMGGDVILKLDSVELTSAEQIALEAHKEFKGRSHTIRMAMGIAVTAAFYPPAAPVFLLTRGRDSTVLKGTEVTAYTKSSISMTVTNLPLAVENTSALSEMMALLPPRTLNGEGREGDMLNLLFVAQEDELQATFARAGWLRVEQSKPQIIWHLLCQRKHYTKLPMNKLYVFGRAQDYSYALPDPRFIVAQRHHLRIWKTDRLVNDVPLWVAAATHDVSIEFVKRKFRLVHRIDPNVDAEREFIAGNLAETRQLAREQYVTGATPVFKAQTETGQPYYSDSRMLLLELNPGTASTAVGTQVAAKMPVKETGAAKADTAPEK